MNYQDVLDAINRSADQMPDDIREGWRLGRTKAIEHLSTMRDDIYALDPKEQGAFWLAYLSSCVATLTAAWGLNAAMSVTSDASTSGIAEGMDWAREAERRRDVRPS